MKSIGLWQCVAHIVKRLYSNIQRMLSKVEILRRHQSQQHVPERCQRLWQRFSLVAIGDFWCSEATFGMTPYEGTDPRFIGMKSEKIEFQAQKLFQ